ncbi:RNA polymerase sigma factor [Fodinibius salsisoli]|uniref:Sigma-70 family RNA polymerase sigma factor n=1 Tax=Fodinibius salsisoli TaxID=2820877 RepID=A0ABT3PL78_9BACT|nr:sigma-70 family RNA polymerase sigma factor [Fodinibius salsisoli]MCW9706478.1 sigma-70 family RNA polymerase sigma factor [Fodinibius salsisoli]
MIPHNERKELDKGQSSEELWESLCEGNRKALNQLFRLFYEPLYDYGIKLVSDPEVVKDGIQKLFLRLWKRREALSQAQSVKAYLLFSLRRILLRIKKSHKTRIKRNKHYLDKTFSRSFSTEEIVIEKELEREKKEKLLEAINALNGRQKEALFLRYYHGLSNGEIAHVMDINRQSVRNHLSRALKSLRTLLYGMPWID